MSAFVSWNIILIWFIIPKKPIKFTTVLWTANPLGWQSLNPEISIQLENPQCETAFRRTPLGEIHQLCYPLSQTMWHHSQTNGWKHNMYPCQYSKGVIITKANLLIWVSKGKFKLNYPFMRLLTHRLVSPFLIFYYTLIYNYNTFKIHFWGIYFLLLGLLFFIISEGKDTIVVALSEALQY